MQSEGGGGHHHDHQDLKYSQSSASVSAASSALSPPDSSLDDLEYEDLEAGPCSAGRADGPESIGSVGTGGGVVKKPHFLDYDNKPPAGLEDQVVFVGGLSRNRTRGAVDENSISQSVTIEKHVAPADDNVHAGTWPSSNGAKQKKISVESSSDICPKMECVYSLLSMLGSNNSLEMSTKFMELSRNRETCSALRRSGCIPLLVQIIHNDQNDTARRNARHALSNVICCHPDDKAGRREVKVLRLIEQLIDYSDLLRDYAEQESLEENPETVEDPEKHPIQSITTLMKISFDEEHRHAMCQLGALQTISTLIHLDHAVHGANPTAPKCVTMRRYAGMILTNLTFGDGNNKSLLCSNKNFMRALVAQIESSSDELVQVTASVLRNLSWRADSIIKQTLSEIGTVRILTQAAMVCTIENTLKAILSALWNLSSHCSPNRSEICEVEGALEFLIDMLSYQAPSKTMSVIENAGGILRNISSHIALREDYRKILRKKNCLKILLEQLKSPSLTVVSNACGTLGNLSGDNYEDQRFLRENGAIPMLRSLIYSKHERISNGSSMALKNLSKPIASMMSSSGGSSLNNTSRSLAAFSVDATTRELPSLNARKKKALEQELEDKFLPKTGDFCREEKEVCATSNEDSPVDDEEEIDEDAVSHSGVILVVEERKATSQEEEEDSEKPVNYSLKEEEPYQDYQETDIDQITDYSLRYGENQSEEESEEENNLRTANPTGGILMAEDTIKCYYTEGTPQIISSATSMSDLRVQMTGEKNQPATAQSKEEIRQGTMTKSRPIPIITTGGNSSGAGNRTSNQQQQPQQQQCLEVHGVESNDTGCNTPDKPYNYCEEGTPDFSRDASLNAIDMSEDRNQKLAEKPPEGEPLSGQGTTPVTPSTQTKQVSFLNTAEETPLMFSRTSSMGSLSSAEPVCTADDKSSIISEFSRFASGVMSPSELPDSPTQSMPHSPKRATVVPKMVRHVEGGPAEPPPVKSAFEDTISKFNVENTPAAFSCATSLSNLSIHDEEKEDEESKPVISEAEVKQGPPVLPMPEASVSEDDGDSEGGDDDLLLESCISMGMSGSRKQDRIKVEERTAAAPMIPTSHGPEDSLQQFCTEDTPAHLSKAPSNCDLSVLSFNTRNGHESDESSNVSDQNDKLLEECIRSGMPQPKNAKRSPLGTMGVVNDLSLPAMGKENPIRMMRNPTHLEPLYANDEMNKFYMEDSPYAFSTVSALSDLTVASETAAQKVNRISTLKGKEPIQSTDAPIRVSGGNDSLSSLSIESDNDEHLLDEAIAAGIGASSAKAKKTVAEFGQNAAHHPQPANRMTVAAVDANDSLDSIDSVESNDPQSNSLLEQCIENGMKKHEEKGFELRAGMNFVQAGLRAAVTSAMPMTVTAPDESIPDSDRDYELLMECIQSGMPKSKNSQLTAELTRNMQKMSISNNQVSQQHQSIPKNVQATPVVTKDPGATNVMSAGVVATTTTNTLSTAAAVDITLAEENIIIRPVPQPRSRPQAPAVTDRTTITTNNITTKSNTRHPPEASPRITTRFPVEETITTAVATIPTITTRSGPIQQQQQRPVQHLPQVVSFSSPMAEAQQVAEVAHPAVTTEQSGYDGGSTSISIMDRSNEFPAAAVCGSTVSSNLLSNSTSEMMQVSNEFMIEEPPSTASDFSPILRRDKHKDPDLMLKSVERLTQELVSTAEYLRMASSTTSDKKGEGTWDEDITTTNEVSFPSLSVQAPHIQHSVSSGGIEDDDTATISDEVDSKALDALEEQTPMNESKPLPGAFNGHQLQQEIHFQLGGEVKHLPGISGFSPPYGQLTTTAENHSISTVSTLTNSTIIAIEASKVANNLQNLAIVESAELDLSKVNPPFGSDSILISDCSDSELTFRNHTPTNLNYSEQRKYSFPCGLVAKRALGHTTFNDSLNSLNNLDSIGPPSIMDELMDSMISVASITSEIADLDSGHAGTVSTGSDANNSSGNSSLTLNSSLENLVVKFSPCLNAALTIPGSPGGKSTPMSPRRAERRQAMKDRYKTYTIPTTQLIDLSQAAESPVVSDGSEGMTTPTPSIPSSPSPKKSSKERRQENKSRYETQVINTSQLGPAMVNQIPVSETLVSSPRTPRTTIIATPAAFSPLTLQSPAPMSLERVLSPEMDKHLKNGILNDLDDDEDDPATYTVQEGARRKSLEQRLPTVLPATIQKPPSSGLPSTKSSPQSSPSKMPTPMAKLPSKPNQPATPVTNPEVVKVVRGTKKPAYVSPYRKSVVSAPAVITRTPAVGSGVGAGRKEPMVTPKVKSQNVVVDPQIKTGRPQPLKARSSLGSKRNSLEINGTGQMKNGDVPKIRDRQSSYGSLSASKAKVAPVAEPLLIRQGTFTKDEPSNLEVPVVTSAPTTPVKTLRKPGSLIPNSASSSRLSLMAPKTRLTLNKSISVQESARTTPSTPTTAGTPAGESTPLTSRFRLTTARTSLVDYKKPNTVGRLSTPTSTANVPESSINGSAGAGASGPATPTSPSSLLPIRRKSGIALPKRTNLTMKSNPDVLKGKLDGVRNAFSRNTTAAAVKTGSR
ncbi:mucin-17-like [Uranotaenia lowii]|uniref:mucin-17-like n=1 Tax=Uranotaenia lowii TaxID=190385 RepID=UPI0024785420|nr:mucin-17-like [Uranotaenia lowii]XP_055598742.1 mucin-17-like [Uranotaenia lowii]